MEQQAEGTQAAHDIQYSSCCEAVVLRTGIAGRIVHIMPGGVRLKVHYLLYVGVDTEDCKCPIFL